MREPKVMTEWQKTEGFKKFTEEWNVIERLLLGRGILIGEEGYLIIKRNFKEEFMKRNPDIKVPAGE